MASTGVRWISVALTAVAVAALTLHVARPTSPSLTTARALDSLSPTDLREPDTVALALHAAALRGDRRLVDQYADRLWDLRVMRGKAAGWGLGYAYDAFQDGSTNLASTIYSYTTAQAGLAYLDAYETTGEPRYLAAARSAADTILDGVCCYRDGRAVWYSTQAADQVPEHVAPNVSGLTAALLLRLPGEGRYREAGRALVDGLLAMREGMGWPYQAGAEKRSDLVHLSFIIRGLAADPRSRPVAMKVANAALREHFTADLEPREDYATLGSSRWGPPAFLVALRQLDHPRASDLARSLAGWEDIGELEQFPRTRAWYAYALTD